MERVMTVAQWMTERSIGVAELIQASKLEDSVVLAIVHGRYTPSPDQRRSLADALGISPEQVAWDHVAQVEHVYGHGPQFGRSP